MFTTRNPLVTGFVFLFTAFGVSQAATPNETGAAPLSEIGTASAGGYTFFNFNGPNSGTSPGAGTNMNGISNNGAAVGFDIDNNGAFHNFIAHINPRKLPGPAIFSLLSEDGDPTMFGTATPLNINGSTAAMAFGINSRDEVVGTDGNGNAFLLRDNELHAFIPLGGTAATAFGINDAGHIVGQFTSSSGQMPGFFVANVSGRHAVRIDAPSGPDTVNAQGLNEKGEIVGFYVGADGQDHGFKARVWDARNGQLTGTAIADPTIPAVAGEPGATFVFSQILGVNDAGLAVGYYGDSTTSQHGFIYNLNTGQYKFLDDPAQQFNNGVEVTQITGINNRNEITGFYSDANGVFHGFVACPNGVACSGFGF